MKLLEIPNRPTARSIESLTPAATTRRIINFGVVKDDAVDVMLYGVIGWELDADDFVTQLKAVTAKTINISINSVGGDVFDGTAIYNALKNHPAKKVVTIEGIAASAASVIAMAGDEIRIGSNAYMMIHRASAVAFGTGDDMRQTGAVMDKVDAAIAGTYSAKTGKSSADIAKLMDAETWMVGQEAVDAGFCNSITDDAEEREEADDSVGARLLTAYNKVPNRFKPRAAGTRKPAPSETTYIIEPLQPTAAHYDQAKREFKAQSIPDNFDRAIAIVNRANELARTETKSTSAPPAELKPMSTKAFDPEPIKKTAMAEFESSPEIQSRFIDADCYGRAVVNEKRAEHAALASMPKRLVPMDRLRKEHESDWDSNADNSHANYIDRDIYLRTRVRDQRQVDRDAGIDRPE